MPLRLGRCPECEASYPSPYPTDRLCPECQAIEDRLYANDPKPFVDTDTDKYSLTNLRERLGVSGNVDE